MKLFSFLYKGKRAEIEKRARQKAEGYLAFGLAKKGLANNPLENEKHELLELLDIAILKGVDEAYLDRGFCLHELGYDIEAIKDLDIAEKIYPTYPELFFARGLSKRILLEIDSSILDFEQALHMAKKCELYSPKDLMRFEIQLKATIDRKRHLESPNLKEALLKQLCEPKRRTPGNS
jgi:tetratricopeptide (TPR) repeat protein